MTRTESHRIDERAKRVFQASLPDNWVTREQHPDYRIDYTIEIFEGDQPSGLFWHAQLKGVKKPRWLKAKNAVSFSMKVDHLKYYFDNVPIPVFLVVIDTSNQKGWWVFLQHYIKTELKSDWRKSSFVTIRLPLDNSISDLGKLREAISNAMLYMRELYPSSVSASIKAEKSRVEILDPRFEVNITATRDGTEYFLKPKRAGIAINIHVKGEDAVAKAKELCEAGGRIDFSGGEAIIGGLIDGWAEDYEIVAVETGRKVPAEVVPFF